MMARSFAGSGGVLASSSAPISRKNSGPSTPGVRTHRHLAGAALRLSKPCDTAADEDGVTGPDFDYFAVNGERHDAGQPINRLVPIAMIVRYRHASNGWAGHFKHVQTAASIMLAAQKTQLERTDADVFGHGAPLLRIGAGRSRRPTLLATKIFAGCSSPEAGHSSYNLDVDSLRFTYSREDCHVSVRASLQLHRSRCADHQGRAQATSGCKGAGQKTWCRRQSQLSRHRTA